MAMEGTSGSTSARIVAGSPGRICASWFSLKFASTHSPRAGTMAATARRRRRTRRPARCGYRRCRRSALAARCSRGSAARCPDRPSRPSSAACVCCFWVSITSSWRCAASRAARALRRRPAPSCSPRRPSGTTGCEAAAVRASVWKRAWSSRARTVSASAAAIPACASAITACCRRASRPGSPASPAAPPPSPRPGPARRGNRGHPAGRADRRLHRLVVGYRDLGDEAGTFGAIDRHVAADIGIVGAFDEAADRPPVVAVPRCSGGRSTERHRASPAASGCDGAVARADIRRAVQHGGAHDWPLAWVWCGTDRNTAVGRRSVPIGCGWIEPRRAAGVAQIMRRHLSPTRWRLRAMGLDCGMGE